MIVRDAREDDVSSICAIAAETWWATYSELMEEESIRTCITEYYEPGLVRSQIADAAAGPDAHFLILEADGLAIGYLHYEVMDDRGPYMRRLYILPAHQGHGWGAMLVEELHRRLGPGNSYELDVHPKNTQAIAFYQSYGAEFTGDHIPPCWDLMRVLT